MIDPPNSQTCVLYLIRHGATEHNLAKPPRLQGSGVDGPLSETGREEARRVAAVLSERNLSAIFSSPMKRAIETAEAVAQPHSLELATVESLREINVGSWEDRTWEEIQQNDADAYWRFKKNPAEHGYTGGENLAQLLERVEPTLTELLQTHIGQEIAVVTHSMVNRVLVGASMGLSVAQSYKLQQANCGLNVIQYRAGNRKMVSVNSISHLL